MTIVCHCTGLLDLAKDEYTFGRGEECDHIFVQTNGKVNPQFSTFSKVHFRLYLVRKRHWKQCPLTLQSVALTHRREIRQISTNTLHLFKTRGGCGGAYASSRGLNFLPWYVQLQWHVHKWRKNRWV